MAFIVNTYASEETLETAIGGTVTTFPDEKTLEDGVNAATLVSFVVAKDAKFTLIDSPTLANIVSVMAKGGKYTVVSGIA